ncbi:related to phospholipid-translocating ATPase [Phialocephala subalpina]|uniref:Related to phospholipid-translocating ATPase n=1 Tax=Phialocephala subalpina TaxID=576137 RepID=A0A1L7WJB6_9HELO|nr:related to phospholipid-translocating ATPase [Phialocephala subalpina]
MSSTISSTASSTTSSSIATCTTATPGKYGYVDPSACNALYEYHPSFFAAILFSGLYGAVTILHIFQAAKFHKVNMVTSTHQHATHCTNITPRFLLQYCFRDSMVQLPFYTSFKLQSFIRMVHFYLPSKSLLRIPGSRFSRYFVWLDIVAFLVQLGGGFIVSGTNVKPSLLHLGIHIYMGGIGLQQFFICIFTGLAIRFHIEMLRLENSGVYVEKGWRRLLYTLYASLALITVRLLHSPLLPKFLIILEYSLTRTMTQLRIVYRLIEYASGESPSNPIPYHEAYFYCLDAVPMFLAALIICITHPGMILKGVNAEFPKVTRKEKKAEKQRRKEAKSGAKLLDNEEGMEMVDDGGLEMGRPLTPTPGYGEFDSGRTGAGERYEPYRGHRM